MQQLNYPKISVVTPSYNQAEYIEETICSVLDQGYPNLEYIIIDGGSTDDSVSIIKKYEKSISFWCSEKDSGQSDALVKGFSKSSGDVLSWLNSDDIFEPETLKTVGKYFSTYPEMEILYGNVNILDHYGKRKYTAYPVLELGVLLYDSPFVPQQSMFWKKRLYNKVGGINPRLEFAMDFDLVLKFLLSGAKFFKVQQVFGNYRFHSSAKSSTIREVMTSEVNQIISNIIPINERMLTMLFKKVYFRCRRFFLEPRSIISAVISRGSFQI